MLLPVLVLYSQVLCGWLLYYTDFSPVVFAVFLLLYQSAGLIFGVHSRMSRFEKPLLYFSTGVTVSLFFATIASWILSIMVLFFHWWLLPLCLVITFLFGYSLLRYFVEIFLVLPIYFYNKATGRE